MRIVFALLLATFALVVAAQDPPLVVSTGSAKGTYSHMFKSMQALCGARVPMQELESSGSDQNIDRLINRKADLAFVQSDALQLTAMNDPRASEAQIRALVPLHPEEVHIVAKASLTKTQGGWKMPGFDKTFGGDKVALNSLADLGGVRVGAWGGSYTTARAIGFLGGIPYEVVQFDNEEQAKAALNKGEIAAIIAVGGQPLGFVSGLDKSYKLLKIEAGLASKVKAYQATRVNYRNLGADSVETVAARALFVTRNYTTPSRRQRLTELRNCLLENEGELKEGTGHHPKWADVDLKAPTVWAAYETVPDQKQR
jgi:uncharacterized protein